MQQLNIGKVILVCVCAGSVKVIGSKLGISELSLKSGPSCSDGLGKRKNLTLLSPATGEITRS